MYYRDSSIGGSTLMCQEGLSDIKKKNIHKKNVSEWVQALKHCRCSATGVQQQAVQVIPKIN